MNSIKRINIDNVLFFDIETAPSWHEWVDVPDNVATEWMYKFKFREDAPPIMRTVKMISEQYQDVTAEEVVNEKYAEWISELWKRQAALFPEFSRVVCVVMGYLYEGKFRVKTYANASEGALLNDFSRDITTFKKSMPGLMFCGHHIKGFDIPFLIKRMICNRVEVPEPLDMLGKKPWEIVHLDTQEIWKFGGSSATLSSLAMALGLPCPKDEMDGGMVSHVFHIENDTPKIVKYCRKDVVTSMNCFKAMRYEEPFLNEEQIEYLPYNEEIC